MPICQSIGRTARLGALAVLGAVTAAHGQVIPGVPYGGSLDAYYQTWDVDEGAGTTTISETYVPINLFLPFTDRFEAKVSSAYVSMTRDTDFDESQSVSGLADVKVQADAVFLQRRLIVGLVANLPSGQGELTGVEQDVVFDFVSPDLSVRTNRLGEGFNLGGTVSFANALSPTVTIGLGASILSRGAYDTALPGSSTPIHLSPGLESRASATLDVLAGASVIRLTSMFTAYGTEKVNDVDYYRIGQEVTLAADYIVGYARGRGQASLGVTELLRLNNSIRSNGSFGEEATSTNGNYLVLDASNRYQVSPKLRVGLTVVGRLVGANDFGVGDSKVIEGGLSATLLPSTNVALSIGGRYISGSGTGFTGRDRSISGIEGMFRTVIRISR